MNPYSSPQISVLEVLNHINSKAGLPVYYIRDWFSNYWAGSYIRMVSIRTIGPSTPSQVLAYLYQNDPSGREFSPHEWLINCTIEDISPEEVTQHLKWTQESMDELADRDQWDEMIEKTIPLQGIDTEKISSAWEIVGLKAPCNKHKYGPTDTCLWHHGQWFYFLEHHQES